MKIAISGPHGSGKTTIGLDLVSILKKKGINATLMPEVARESPYLIANEQSPYAQLQIFGAHIDAEMRFARGVDVLVADRCILDHVMYMELFFPQQTGFIEAMKTFSREYVKTYDFVFKTSKIYESSLTKDNLRPKDSGLQTSAALKLGTLLNELCPAHLILPEEGVIEYILDRIGY